MEAAKGAKNSSSDGSSGQEATADRSVASSVGISTINSKISAPKTTNQVILSFQVSVILDVLIATT